MLENLDSIVTFLELGNIWEIDNNTLLNVGSFFVAMYGCISCNNVSTHGYAKILCNVKSISIHLKLIQNF